jgi:hypothetical protein
MTMAQTENADTSIGVRRMFAHDLQWWLDIANTAYLWALIVGAIAALAIAVTSWLVIKWQAEIQQEKDRAFDQYKIESRKQVATLEKETADAKLEQEKLKSRLAWRILPPEIEGQLHAALAANIGRVNIEYVANDTETLYFAIQLANIFGRANWQVGFLAATLQGVMLFGIFVPDSESTSTALVRVALTSAHVGFSPDALPNVGATGSGSSIPNAAVLFIGSKSPPK